MDGCSSDCPQLFSFGCFRRSRLVVVLVARSLQTAIPSFLRIFNADWSVGGVNP
jgi:hypothetical protein